MFATETAKPPRAATQSGFKVSACHLALDGSGRSMGSKKGFIESKSYQSVKPVLSMNRIRFRYRIGLNSWPLSKALPSSRRSLHASSAATKNRPRRMPNVSPLRSFLKTKRRAKANKRDDRGRQRRPRIISACERAVLRIPGCQESRTQVLSLAIAGGNYLRAAARPFSGRQHSLRCSAAWSAGWSVRLGPVRLSVIRQRWRSSAPRR